MKKSVLIALAAVIVCGVGYLALTPDGGGSSSEEAQPAQVQENAKYKDTIVFCQGNDLVTMDIIVGIQERSIALTNNIFESLFGFDDDMNVVPVLAEEYEWLDDKSLKVKIRSGVKFHDGTELTANDVKYSMDSIDEAGSLFAGAYDKTDIVDDHTVVIRMKQTSPTLLNLLAVAYAGIVPEKARSADPKAFGQHPIGTGPYKLQEFQEGDYYKLERFDDYWRGPAKTKYLVMRIVPESSQRQILVETGDVDVAYEIHPNTVARVKDNPDMKILTSDSTKIISLHINVGSDGPLGNVLVRKAIMHAIDKQAIIDNLLAGYGEATVSMIPVGAKDYVVQEDYKYDIELAKNLMKEAGCENGFETVLWVDSNQTNTETAQFIQNQLAQIGIKVSIVVQDPNTTFSLIKAGADFGMILDFFNLTTGHGDLVFKRMLYSTSNSNWCNYKKADYDKAYDEYSSTPEGEKREELLKKVNSYFLNDVPLVSLYNEKKILLASSGLEGLKVSRIGWHNYYNATVAEK